MTGRRVVLLTLALTLPLVLIAGCVLLVAGVMGAFQADESGSCEGGSGPVVEARGVGGLTPSQLANASAIITEGTRMRVPVRGIVVALAVANQESHFTNYANDGKGGDLISTQKGIAASLRLPHEAVGTDHGSLGVFQQQWPWWGNMRELMTPGVAAQKFYRALLSLPSWQSEPVTVAAQMVQSSAYPDAYADDEPLARELLGLSSTPTTSSVARVEAPADCAEAEETGEVVFPLPARSGFRDNRNFGGRGGHWASVHTGDDLSVACGTPVLAATDGKVVVVTNQSWAGRWLVQVSTGTGQLTTWYAHMRALTVGAGESVTAGQQIGEVGSLGNATGCHLHFEVHPRGGSIYEDSVDPSAWLSRHIGRDGGVAKTVRSASWASSGEAFTVATFNTLGSSHTERGGKAAGMASGPTRTRGVVRLLGQYGVDVVGFQEFQRPQARAFDALAGATYGVWHPRGDTENAIAYRRDRWQLVAAQSLPIPYFDGHIRRMPVVRLRDRVSQADVTFVNVHNPADTRRYRHQGRWRRAAVAREAALTRNLSSSGSPVIMTGDLNDRRIAFCRLASSGGLASSTGGSGSPCAPARRSGIDWILGSQSLQFSDHTVVRNQLVRRTTDHPVVMARARVAP